MATMRGVISDLDGTLIDSNDAHAQAWTRALREFGYDVTFEQIRRLVGMGGDNLLPTSVQLEADSPRGKAIVERRNAIFRAEYMSTLKAFPKVRALFERMQAE